MGAQRAESVDHILVTSQNVVYIMNFCSAFGTQRRDHQRRAAPQVGCAYLCTV